MSTIKKTGSNKAPRKNTSIINPQKDVSKLQLQPISKIPTGKLSTVRSTDSLETIPVLTRSLKKALTLKSPGVSLKKSAPVSQNNTIKKGKPIDYKVPTEKQEEKKEEVKTDPVSLPNTFNNVVEQFNSPIDPPSTSDGNNRKNVRVYARVRPLNEVEKDLMDNNIGAICVEQPSPNSVIVKNVSGHSTSPFGFDRVFPGETEQEAIYNVVGKEIAQDVLAGYNGTIFAYGQSGSGKTHTMYGQDIYDEEQRGIIPRLIIDILDYVNTAGENVTFEFKMSILQIYKEMICDLITGEKDLKIKEHPVNGIYVDKLSEVYISTIEGFMDYIDLAIENRIVSETKLNSTSSRSHSILIFEVTQKFRNESFSKKGTLNLVDLAGSEKISKTGAVGETLEEAKKINLSLSSLGHVIHSLTSGADYIPYRDSKLTRILQESLGGNFKTSLIVTCSPHSYHYEETVSSFQFAQRAKNIKNKAKINIKLSYDELQKIITQLRRDLSKANNEIIRLKGLPHGEEYNLITSEMDSIELKQTGSLNLINNNSIEENKEEQEKSIDIDTNPIKQEENKQLDTETKEIKETTTKRKELILETIDDNTPSAKEPPVTIKATQFRTQEIKCINCLKYSEIIQQLKTNNEDLNMEIKEKETFISTLDNANKEKADQIDELKEKIEILEANNSRNNSNDNFKKNNDLYEVIKAKLLAIEKKQSETNKLELNMTHLDKMIKRLNTTLQGLYETNVKNSYENSSNGHIMLMNNVAGIVSQTLGIANSNSISSPEEYTALNDIFKQRIDKIFDGIFHYAQNDIGKYTIQDQNKETKDRLLHVSSMFLFGYLNSYSSLQISRQLNHKTNIQNDILKNINLILIDIVEDLLKSNIDIKQQNNILGFENMKGYNDFEDASPSPMNKRNNRKCSAKMIGNFNEIIPRAKGSGKILVPMSRLGQETQKVIQTRLDQVGESNTPSNNFTDFMQLHPIASDSDEDIINTVIPEGLPGIIPSQHVPSNKKLPTILSPRNKMVLPSPSNRRQSLPGAGGFNNFNFTSYIKKQNKKKSKLTLMKEYIVKALKDTEQYKNELDALRTHIINAINTSQDTILLKLLEGGIIKDNDSEFNISLQDQEFLSPNDLKYGPQETIEEAEDEENDNAKQAKTSKPTKTKVHLNKLGYKYWPFAQQDNNMKRLSQNYLMSVQSNCKIDNCMSLECTPIKRFNYSYEFSSCQTEPIYKEKNIEDLIEDYLQTGTATRRFDGISVKYHGSRVKCLYQGGLSAHTHINKIPLQGQLIGSAGDDTLALLTNDDNGN